MDDTLEEESMWMILVELEVENSPLYRSCEDFFTSKYCEDFFSSKYCCLQATDNEFPGLHCTCHRQLRMQTVTK